MIPALIRKFAEAVDAGAGLVTVWGTGQPTRDFLYVGDAAEGLVAAMEQYNEPEPVNLGSGQEISIRELAGKVKDAVDFKGAVHWDRTRPDGQARRLLDVTRAQRKVWVRRQDLV